MRSKTVSNSFLGILLLASLVNCSRPSLFQVASPDGNIKLELEIDSGNLFYTTSFNKSVVIDKSIISLFPNKKVELIQSENSEHEEKWKPVWGQFSELTSHYREVKLKLDYEGFPANLYARVFNDGIGFRFEIDNDHEDMSPILKLEYGLADDAKFYMPAGEGEPLGPLEIKTLSDKDLNGVKWKMPLVIETSTGPFLSLLESDLMTCPGFEVIDFSFDKEKGCIISENPFDLEDGSKSTPWRIILLEKDLGDLVTNQVALHLASPNKLESSEWILNGKAVWDWRVHGFTSSDGFTYGINTESYLRFIDFASKNKIEYFLIDDAWYTDVAKDKIISSTKLDLEKIANYADQKGVSLILYYDRRKGDYGDQNLFPFYKSMGMKGIKYGFMGANTSFTRESIKLGAENELLVNFHDAPVPLTGVSRTFPNAITREYNHAQQDARRTFTPETFIKMALINAVQGPLDMNNGIFDIIGTNAGEREKGPKTRNSLLTTVVAEAARVLIIHTGLACLPDAPEAYEAKSDLFEFIKNLDIGKWDESRVIYAKMGEHISTARRSGKDWFVGSVSSKKTTLQIPLDFLDKDQKYAITFYEDTKETNCKTNPEAYQIRRGEIEKGDIVRADIVEGGGHCMWIRAL